MATLKFDKNFGLNHRKIYRSTELAMTRQKINGYFSTKYFYIIETIVSKCIKRWYRSIFLFIQLNLKQRN